MDNPNPSMLDTDKTDNHQLSFESFRNEVLNDYYIACLSREASLLGWKRSGTSGYG
jgi:hypothetical protein